MSPPRSLLACAALLAVAGAGSALQGRYRNVTREQREYEDHANKYHTHPAQAEFDCTTTVWGTRTLYEVALDMIILRERKNLVKLPNMDEDIVGQEFLLCNVDKTGVPYVVLPPEGFSPFAVLLAEDTPEPVRVTLHAVQYLKRPRHADF